MIIFLMSAESIVGSLLIIILIFIFYLIWAERTSVRLQRAANFTIMLRRNGFEFVIKDEVEIIKRSSKKNLFVKPFAKFPNFTISKNGVTIFCEKGSTNKGQYSEPAMIFNVIYPINPNFYLEVRKRGFLEKFLRINKGELSDMNQELNIKSSNLLVAKSIINENKLKILNQTINLQFGL